MSNFNDDKLDKMLKAYCTRKTENYTFKKPRYRKVKYTAIIAACIAILLLTGTILTPAVTENNSQNFIIVTNTKAFSESDLASADEITSDTYVQLTSLGGNYVQYDFDEILNSDAPQYNMIQSYLFHTISKHLDIRVVGENIETVTYKTNQGAMNLIYCDDINCDHKHNEHALFGYDIALQEYTASYEQHQHLYLCFTPVYSPDSTYKQNTLSYAYADPNAMHHHYFMDSNEYVYSFDSDELHRQYGWVSGIGLGVSSSAPTVVTDEEKEALKAYTSADDMVGFFNYQNKIFKRLIDGATIDIIVTKTNGTSETKTLELMYVPDEVTSSEWYLDNQYSTYSTGEIYAKLVP